MKRFPLSCCLAFLFILVIAGNPAAATPYVADVTPSNGANTGVVTLTIQGSMFNPERTAVYLSPADSCNSNRIPGIIESISSDTITARFSLIGERPGYYSMWVNCPVTDPDGKLLDDKSALFKGFWIYQGTVTPPPLTLIPLAGAWTGSNADTVGLYLKNNGTFFLKNSNGAGDADTVFQYGAGGDDWSPLVGDWDNNGSDTVGLYQTSTGTFFLKNSNGAGPGDLGFPYGAGGADWIHLAGDWDGDGNDTVGAYQKSIGVFFLKNSNGAGDADTVFQYGAGGDDWSPLVGDWDNNGSDTVGLYQTSTGTFFLKNSNNAGPGDLGFPYGAGGADWVHLAGDWDGDGNDTVGAYQKSIGTFFLKNSNGTGDADNIFQYAP